MLPVGPDDDMSTLIRPGELYALAAELWLSIQLHIAENRDPVSVYPTHYLMSQPGYWKFSDLEIFLFEYIYHEVESRLELARKLANLPSPKAADRLLHPYMLPWSVNPPTYAYDYFDGVDNKDRKPIESRFAQQVNG